MSLPLYSLSLLYTSTLLNKPSSRHQACSNNNSTKGNIMAIKRSLPFGASFSSSSSCYSLWRIIMILVAVVIVNVVPIVVMALDNGLGLVPPMGWNSWNQFHCNVSEELIISMADRIIDLGLDMVGYRYINIDDCWMAHNRTAAEQGGELVGNSETFPHGMKYIGDYLHNRSLLFGIYSDAGVYTCAGFPASLGYEAIDAQTLANWGVDYLKYDNCNNQFIPSIDRYTIMRDALNATGRPIFYSLCQGGWEDSWQWAPAVGNSWRTTADIEPDWETIKSRFWESQRHLERGGPGAWLDPDMLEVGNGALTLEESKSHFALWALAKAPLLLGNDLYKMNQDVLDVITNRHLIALHQDALVKQITCFIGCSSSSSNKVKWSALATRVPVSGDSIVIIINWSNTSLTNLTFAAHAVGVVPMMPNHHHHHHQVVVQVTDLWTDTVVGNFTGPGLKTIPVVPAILMSHSCALYRLSVKAQALIAPPPTTTSK